MEKRSFDIMSIDTLGLADVEQALSDFANGIDNDIYIALRLNRKYRELTGHSHEGYEKQALIECEKYTENPAYTETTKKFYRYLRREILEGVDYISIVDDISLFEKMSDINNLSDDEIDKLLRFFNDIPILVRDDVVMPFENPSLAVLLNDEYEMRKGHYHPTYVEHALDILPQFYNRADVYHETGLISCFVIGLMGKSLNKIWRQSQNKNPEEKNEGSEE